MERNSLYGRENFVISWNIFVSFLKIVGLISNFVWIFQKPFECLPEFFNAVNKNFHIFPQLSNIYILVKKLVWQNEIYPRSGDGGPSLGLSLLFHQLYPEWGLLPTNTTNTSANGGKQGQGQGQGPGQFHPEWGLLPTNTTSNLHTSRGENKEPNVKTGKMSEGTNTTSNLHTSARGRNKDPPNVKTEGKFIKYEGNVSPDQLTCDS